MTELPPVPTISESQLRHDELEILRAWRQAGPFSTVTLQKFRGRYSHGKIEVNIKPAADPLEPAR